MWHKLATLLALALLTGCTNVAPLKYTGTPRTGFASTTVTAVTVTDRRGEPDPTWYGAIRGGYANPLKTLHADAPIAVTVRDAFVAALAVRGIAVDPNARAPSVSVTVAEFEADRVARSEVKIRFDVTVADASGRQVYEQEAVADPVSGSVWDTVGIFADPKDLQALAQTTMDQTIDQALDAPGFQAAIRLP